MSSAATSRIELRTLDDPEQHSPVESDGVHFALPPVDRGKDAYLVLTACFILEALVWGFPFAFGVFQNYYMQHEQFNSDLASIAAIGTTSTGIMYFGAPLIYGVLRKRPGWRKPASIAGFAVMLAALVGASFASNIQQLLATQGVLYGIGGAVHYFPAFCYVDEWFVSRRGFAYGVIWAGGGAAGVALPLTFEWILDTFGFRTALRAWVVVEVVLTVPALVVMKGRLPLQHASTGPQKLELGFFRSKPFWIMQIANMVQGLGYFMPALYLPSFAQAVGLSSLSGTIAISLLNAANIVGAVFVGFLVDRYHVTTVVLYCAVGTTLACLVLWTFAVYSPVLFLFAIMYGLTAGGYSATWAGVTDTVRRKYPAVETGMIIAVCSAGKGMGAVISGPLSGALVRSDVWKDRLGYAFGSGYGYLIIVSGVTAGFSSIGWFTRQCGAFK